jgi:pimeloyl-ACP methyl ester carboxylesterase/DNA-binding winged helix-turn-helix (wHTH) protein
VSWRFGRFELDRGAYELRCDGEPRAVAPLVFDLLVHLVEHRDRVVSKSELLDEVWGDRFVTNSALTRCVKELRSALDDDGKRQAVIRTVHGRGYRFVAALDRDGPAEVAPTTTRARTEQEIRFCRAHDGTRLAYATAGDGPPLVKAANWLSHLEDDWDSAVWRHWWTELTRRYTLTRYDERGCGLSDWDTERFDLATWVDDLEAVVDAAGIERFDLLGISAGGAVATAFAAAHPERVRRLVLYGAYTRGRAARAGTDDERAEAALQIELARAAWGRDDPAFRRVFAMQFMPSAGYDLWEHFAVLQRRTTSAENAVRFMQAYAHLDVVDAAAALTSPTLVMHSRGEQRVPLEEGRRLAATIPDCRFVALDSENHILLADEPAWPRFLAELDRFLLADH